MNLPPGFEIEQTPASGINLPPGFELEEQPDQEQGGYWSDVGKNVVEGLKEIPSGAMNLAKTVGRVSNVVNPVAQGISLAESAYGVPYSQTPGGQGIEAGRQFLKSIPSAVIAPIKTVGKAVAMPLEVAGGTPSAKTMFGKQFRERPLGTISDLALTAYPAGKLFKGAARKIGSEVPNVLERFGSRGVLSSSGISPKTLERLSGRANPSEVGTQLGIKLTQEGVPGLSARTTFDNAQRVMNEYGRKVEDSLRAIKETNSSLGVYPELADPLKVEATKVLKPITDEYAELANSSYRLDRQAARPWKELYDSLIKKSESNNGFIGLDDVRGEMQKIGKMFDYVQPDSEKFKMVSKLYGKLADTRDSMVEMIAKQSGNPELASNLLKANEGYSRYSKIFPDLKRKASKEGVGTSTLLKHPIESIRGATEPLLSKTALKAGGLPRKILKTIGSVPEAKAIPGQTLAQKVLTESKAREILREAKGNKDLARKKAREAGYSFD